MTPATARDVALEVGQLAGRALLEGWGHAGTIRAKAHPTDLVTEWDARIEALIATELAARAPGVAMLGEELGGREEQHGERWIVDPVDGTVNFAHALPLFGISIGFERDGEPEAGVVVAPALGWTWAAAVGHGATRNGVPIRVSQTERIEDALLVTGFPYDRKESTRNNFAAWTHMQLRANAVRRLGAASLDLCFVATGWVDGYWELKLKPWDLSAGAVIVREAGGQVTGLDGGPFRSSTGEVVASNGRIHDALVGELLGRV